MQESERGPQGFITQSCQWQTITFPVSDSYTYQLWCEVRGAITGLWVAGGRNRGEPFWKPRKSCPPYLLTERVATLLYLRLLGLYPLPWMVMSVRLACKFSKSLPYWLLGKTAKVLVLADISLFFPMAFSTEPFSLLGQPFKVLNLCAKRVKRRPHRGNLYKVIELILYYLTSRVHAYIAIHLHPRLDGKQLFHSLGLLTSLLWTKEELAKTGIISNRLLKEGHNWIIFVTSWCV